MKGFSQPPGVALRIRKGRIAEAFNKKEKSFAEAVCVCVNINTKM
jgi:hypothetical protein